MKESLKSRLIVLACFLVPALLAQSVVPLVDEGLLEDLADQVLAVADLLEPERPLRAENVLVVEIDNDSIRELGWPIARRHYVTLLETLNALGKPWVLSLLSFQATDQGTGEGPAADEAAKLAAAIVAYERLIGASLIATPGEELSDEEESVAREKALLFRDGVAPETLPYLPLFLREALPFVRGQARFGMATRFGVDAVVRCMPMYLDDVARSGRVVIPSAVTWAMALHAGRGLSLDNGVAWRNPASPDAQPLLVSEKHCLGATVPSIPVIPLRDLLNGTVKPELKGRLVVLASADMRKFQGPGAGGVVGEHVLVARFLADLVAGVSVRRPPLASLPAHDWLPLAYFLVGGLAAMTVRRRYVLLVAGLAPVLLWGYAVDRLHGHRLLDFPLPLAFSATATLILLAIANAQRRRSQRRALRSFVENLRHWSSKCNTLVDLETAVHNSCLGAYRNSAAYVSGYDELLYKNPYELQADSAETSQALAMFSDELNTRGPREFAVRDITLDTAVHAGPHGMTTDFVSGRAEFTFGARACGTLVLKLPRGDRTKEELLEILRDVVDEVAVHWERIELLQMQRYNEWRQALVNKDLELGRAVQALLLPPSLEGQRGVWDFRIIYQPFGAMSGDWIQTHTPDASGQRTLSVFALGDVIGKGPSAALITSAIASAWSRLKVEGDAVQKVREFVSSMNETIITLFKGSQYTTMSLALLIDGTAYLACFAAPPWIVVNTRTRSVRKVRVKPANSIGLSSFRTTFELLEVPLQPGDVLVAYTDGVMEGFACYQRLSGLVKDGLKDDDSVFAQLESLARAAGESSVHPDDFSMLMLRRAA